MTGVSARRRLHVVGFVAVLSLAPVLITEAQAQLCSLSATAITFGSYNVFDANAIDVVSTITVSCVVSLSVQIRLDKGTLASSFSPRQMGHGSDRLNYNLYFDAAHTQVWGDGSAGTVSWNAGIVVLSGTSHTVYGRATALQDVSVGNYTDTVTVTAIF